MTEATTAVVPMKPEPREIAEREDHGSVALMRLIERVATSPDFDVAKLEKLLEVKERWEANEARKAFNGAFADFKAEAVKIIKRSEIKDGPLKGKFHANLYDVVDAVTPHLSKHEFAISWKLSKDEPTWMEVNCILRHVGGHSESVSMGGAPDTGPGRNAIQARGSTKSYLERYTATAILGLATQDQDDDGGRVDFITADQKAELIALQQETKADTVKFLAYLGVESLDDLPAKWFERAKQALEAKRSKAK